MYLIYVGQKVPTLANLRFFTPNPFSESHFWTFINVHFWKSQNTFRKSNVCEHNEKLASHDQKNIFHFVTIKFLFLERGFFRHFFCCKYIATNGNILQH